MKDIVVMFVHTRDLNLPAEQPPDIPKLLRAKKSFSNDSSLPQFWTWFIENPRPGPSHSYCAFNAHTTVLYAVGASAAEPMIDVAASSVFRG
jgi:hypothetical protein